MANIKVKIGYPIKTGVGFTFHAPCDCSEAEGLTVEHPGGVSKFMFRDAHGNVLTDTHNLFAAGSLVKAVLDLSAGAAFLQNADTNAYLEQRLGEASCSVQEQNKGTPVRLWIGTEEEYERDKDNLPSDTFCLTTDGKTSADFVAAGHGNCGEVIPNLGVFENDQTLNVALKELLGTMELATPKRVRFAVNDMDGVACGTAMWDCDIVRTSDGNAMLTGRSLFTGNGVTIIRKAFGGDITLDGSYWEPAEWVNPPMSGGVSYRTTERRHNKPVYVACLNITAPAVGGAATGKITADGALGTWDVVDISGALHKQDGNGTMARQLSDIGVRVYSNDDRGNEIFVAVATKTEELVGASVKIIVKYTKGT